MRSTITAAIVVALLVAAPSTANAAPKQDEVTGKGTIGSSNTIDTTVRSDEDGSKPRGVFGWEDTGEDGIKFKGKPTCMVVDGNTAIIGGHQENHPSGYNQFFVYIEDNGDSGDRSLTAVSVTEGEPDQQECLNIRSELTRIPEFLQTVEGDFAVLDR